MFPCDAPPFRFNCWSLPTIQRSPVQPVSENLQIRVLHHEACLSPTVELVYATSVQSSFYLYVTVRLPEAYGLLVYS